VRREGGRRVAVCARAVTRAITKRVTSTACSAASERTTRSHKRRSSRAAVSTARTDGTSPPLGLESPTLSCASQSSASCNACAGESASARMSQASGAGRRLRERGACTRAARARVRDKLRAVSTLAAVPASTATAEAGADVEAARSERMPG